MSPLAPGQVEAYLRARVQPPLAEPLAVEVGPATAEEQRYPVRGGGGFYTLTRYAASARDRARREALGLRVAGGAGLAPAAMHVDLEGAELGGYIVLAQRPEGHALGDSPLSDDAIDGWLLLLLTLHHLPPQSVDLPSSMSADPTAWWQRIAPAWEACRAAYAGAALRPLLEALERVQAIVQVRIETNRALWTIVARRPCHGNPLPAHVIAQGSRLTLVEWNGFGLGDPAMEIGRAATVAALAGDLTDDQYRRMLATYISGMRDVGDAALEERLRVFTSVVPLGVAVTLLDLLARPGALEIEERAQSIAQVGRALAWLQRGLGVAIGEPATLLQPLSAPLAPRA